MRDNEQKSASTQDDSNNFKEADTNFFFAYLAGGEKKK